LKRSELDSRSLEIFTVQLRRTALVLLIAFSVLILRLWYLQVLQGSNYRAKSETNRIRLRDLTPFRGVIADRGGETLVDNRPSYGLFVIPEEIQDREMLLERLEGLIGLDREASARVLDRAEASAPFRPVCLRRNLSRDELAVIETHRFNLPGAIIEVTAQRHYRYGPVAAHVIGYLGEINENQLQSGKYPRNRPGDLVGKSGVEQKWHEVLNGFRGGEQVEVDAVGRTIRVLSKRSSSPGANLTLTIDLGLQTLAESLLEGSKGAVVALDPNNGRVLALVSRPSFDPNVFAGGIERAQWEELSKSPDFPLQNRALSGQYPPGSVFKIVVALAALEHGVVSPTEEIYCKGYYTLGDRPYRCWKKHGHGHVNLQRAIAESCDVYFYTLGLRLGPDKIADMARKLGLGQITGFESGHEKAGLIPTREWKLKRLGIPWQAGESLSTAIGQSFVLITPVQAACMISTLYNGGVRYRPQVTERVGRGEGDALFQFTPQVLSKAELRPDHVERIKRGLYGVVNEPRGTGSKARLKEAAVAGKTGTAQVIALGPNRDKTEEENIPKEYRDHAWFVCVAPAERPEIALAVLVENAGHGGSVSAPIAGKLIQAYLNERKMASLAK
jgi:penicillin-binding protein 2